MSPTGTSEFRTKRRVEFADTDMAGIIHFSAYFRFMEQVEHEFLRSVGTGVNFPDESDPDGRARLGFPRLAARCEFVRPLRFEDETEVRLRVVRLGDKSITYQFLFSLDVDEVARGEVSVACVRILPNGGAMKGITIPPVFRQRIAVHDGQRLDFGPSRRERSSPDEEESTGES